MTGESKLHPRRGRTGASGLGAAKSVALLLGLVALLYVSVEATGGRRLLQDKVGSVMGVDLGAAFSSVGLSMSTTAAGLEIKEYCKKVHSSELAWYFRNRTVDVPFYTACPSASWVDRFHQLGKDKPLTMVDIGCNKGYSSAHAFGLWAPELGFAPNTLRTKRPEVGCGTCNDCAEEAKSSVDRHQAPVTLYCVEPSMRNFANLILTRDAFFPSSAPADVQWYIVNAAMSNSTGLAHFPRGCQDELCSLQGNSDGTTLRDFDYVPLATVDAFVKDYEIASIDLMKVDTEGFDATVLQGAMELLARGGIGVLSFEYHEVGVWREYSLRQNVERLDGLDYVCYFDGKNGEVTRMTSCWDDAYEMYSWSNVVCVHRKHFMYPELELMSTRFAKHRDEYFAGPRAAPEPAA